MTHLWKLWSKDHGIISVIDLDDQQWLEIQAAAQFSPGTGRRANDLVANDLGHLYLVDTCDEAHHVNPLLFVAVRP